jgi:hypothetical protein
MSSDKIEQLTNKFSKLNIQKYKNDANQLRFKLFAEHKKIKTDKNNKVKTLSYTNSQAAKNGYKEEELVSKDLNNKTIKDTFMPILGNNYNKFSRIPGKHKCDIQSDNKILKAQIKKYKQGQFQQLDRHWTSNLIKNIPELDKVSQILKDLFEYPLLPNGTHVDKTKNIKKLCNSNYSQEILNNLLDLLNKFKTQILEYAFYGNNLETQPAFLFGVEYKNKQRNKILLFKIHDIIKYLEKLNFKISPQKTVILLGNCNTISLQRKGGDCGKKSSNQLQIKLILSNLINKVSYLEYKL